MKGRNQKTCEWQGARNKCECEKRKKHTKQGEARARSVAEGGIEGRTHERTKKKMGTQEEKKMSEWLHEALEAESIERRNSEDLRIHRSEVNRSRKTRPVRCF